MELSTIRNTLNIATDRWIKLPKTSIITTNRNGNININGSYIFYFDSSNKLLYISINNNYNNIDNLDSSKSAYPVNSTTDFKTITGFVSAYTEAHGLYLRK